MKGITEGSPEVCPAPAPNSSNVKSVRPLAVAATIGAVVLTGCSGGAGSKHQAAATSTTTTTGAMTPAEQAAAGKTISLAAFCGRENVLFQSTAQIGTATQLSEVKARMASVAQLMDVAAVGGTPAGSNLFPILLALDHDMQTVNQWIQTKATQADLNHDSQPADVQSRFNDLGAQFRTLQSWATPHCKAYSNSDNS